MHHFSKQEVFCSGAPVSVKKHTQTSIQNIHTHEFIELVYIEKVQDITKLTKKSLK